MKRRKVWAITGVVVLLLIVIALPGCVSKSEYEALQSDYAMLLQENNSLKEKVEGTQTDLMNVQADHDMLQADYYALQADCDALQADLNELDANYGAVSRELTEIKAVYPPRYFKDYDELQHWLDEALPQIDTYETDWRQHLDLQKLALYDGYIWSVGLQLRTNPISFVVAGNSIYQVYIPGGNIEWIGWQ